MGDYRQGTIPDFSYSRIEFFLVGTENIWGILPSKAGEEPLLRGRDVIVYGTRLGRILNENGKQIAGEFIKAREIFFVKAE